MLMSLTLLSTSMTLGIILASNPATLSIWIILSSISITCAIGFNTINWFGLIIFLIYVGGMLVMFSYFVVIQPNQQLEMKKMMTTSLISTLMLALLMTSSYKPLQNIQSQETMKSFALLLPNSIPILLSIAIILFIALVAVIKMSKINQGPLRPFSPSAL